MSVDFTSTPKRARSDDTRHDIDPDAFRALTSAQTPQPSIEGVRAALARRSFSSFVEQAWSLVEPARPYVRSTASEAIVEHLQAVGDGRIRRLLVALPPGLGKSTFCSVLYPAWRFARDPSWRGVFGSHAHTLAVRDSLRTRRLVQSPWFKQQFGVELRDDENRSDYWATTAEGRRIAVGVDGALVGFRATEALVDDPLNTVDARSKTTRDHTNRWFVEALSTRLDDPDNAPRIVIQQRLHSDDLIGYLLAAGGWEALILPAEYDARRRTTTCIWEDPRTEPSQLLAPQLHSRDFLDRQRVELGSAAYSCQYLQSPTDDEGGMFQREWWGFYKTTARLRRPFGATDKPAVELPKRFDHRVISIDCAFKGGPDNDYVVMLVLGVHRADRYVLDVVRRQLDFTSTCKQVRALAASYPFAKILIEDAANGPAVISALAREVAGLIPVRPDGGKEARAAAISPQVESGNVFLPEGAPWVADFIDELAAFPRGKHDDQVDAFSQALGHAASRAASVTRTLGLCRL